MNYAQKRPRAELQLTTQGNVKNHAIHHTQYNTCTVLCQMKKKGGGLL